MRPLHFIDRNKGLVITALSLGAIALLSGIALVLLSSEKAPELFVEETYFEVSRSKGDRIPISVIVILSNNGNADAEDVYIEVLAVEADSNLARGNGTSYMDDLPAGRSMEIRSLVNVPRNATFRLEILIFKAHKLTIWGSGIADLAGLGKDWNYRTEENLDDPPATSGGGGGGALCIVLLIMTAGGAGLVLLLLFFRKKGGPAAKSVQEEKAAAHPAPVQMDLEKYEMGPKNGDCPDVPSNW